MVAADTKMYMNLLQRWIHGASPYIKECHDRSELLYYGTGDNGWGVQTNQKAFAAWSTAAMDPRFDEGTAGITRETAQSMALKLLRFSLETHWEGSYRCTDNTRWGHTWISVLGLERMMHGVEALEGLLTEHDRQLLRRVLISECDWLLDHYEIVGGLYNKDGNNKPESNLWNGALLLRTTEMFPDCSRAERYREKGLQFLMNSISVPADATDSTILHGKPASDWFIGANFFDSLALNHHGYLNVGYMVICLSNMAMLHFMYRRQGTRAPEALYRHMEELWKVVKLCTFSDGRLLRIGGDTRVRYTYCQDYVIPAWLMIADVLGDQDCERFERGWLEQVQLEMDASGDGTFLSARCRGLSQSSPLYYTRLESDRAAALSMGLAWKPIAASAKPGKAWGLESADLSAGSTKTDSGAIVIRNAYGESWHDGYHGAYVHRGQRRTASWVWEAAEKPQGLCLPNDASDMAEWKENLAVQLKGLGKLTEQRLESHDGAVFQGGFLTWGSTLIHTSGLLAEGQKDHDLARSRIVCAALPDDQHVIVLQYTSALERSVHLHEVKGLHLVVPNDLFNGDQRTYFYEKGERTLRRDSAAEAVRTDSLWINADNRLGAAAIYGAKELTIYHPGRRQIGLKEKWNTVGVEGMLHADELCGPFEQGLLSVIPGEIIVDAGFVIHVDDSSETRRLALERSEWLHGPTGNLRTVSVTGADGYTYILVANIGSVTECAAIQGPALVNVVTGEVYPSEGKGSVELMITPGTAQLLRVQS
ncbi:hypothetical protein DVH26_18815 [Paenibacillus sp. H1-7]|uniref:hypothetical protein n=1 Tax=Paenibacillus sp. H1-7 TaxID=2282849 RepID=UPI001EF89663|nr:hypothetical protein [Paenibacillus sp. H1-7]ULL16318.1 hypothetical protein DVH26_18815 [Paenibacillus sp. H1-7]